MLSCYGWEVREEHVFLSNFRAEIRLCLLVQGHDSVLEQSTTCSHLSVLESPLSVWQKHPQCVTGKQELLLRLIEYVVSLFWIREKLAINWLKRLEVKWQKLLSVSLTWESTHCSLRASSPPGGVFDISLGGEVRRGPHTLTLFKTNIADFPTLFKTKIPKNIPWLAARPH